MQLPLLIISLCSLLATSSLWSRVGDSRSDLENRLLRGSGNGLEVTDDDLETFFRQRSPVFNSLLILKDDDVDYIIYYKPSGDWVASSGRLWQENEAGRRGDKPLAKPEGWMLHVVYLNGTSVLEYYSRSEPLTEVEVAGVLARHAGTSRWIKGRIPTDDESIIPANVFPADHFREDKALYAKVNADSIVIFDPRLDARIDELRKEKAQEEGPGSLEGF